MKRHTPPAGLFAAGLLAAGLLPLSAAAFAEGFTGPAAGQAVTAAQVIPVGEARNLPDKSWVTLAGSIVGALPGGKYYTFRDSSGEVTVEIGAKEWRGLSVGVSDRVEVCGEVKVKSGQMRVKVKAIAGPGQTVAGRYGVLVSEAGRLPHDYWAVLTGNIVGVSVQEKDRYTFRDSSGEITVKIKRDVWRGLSAGSGDRLEISGKVKVKNGEVTVDVDAVRRV